MATYARQPAARSSTGWDVSGNVASLHSAVSFPTVVTPGTGITQATYFSVGKSISGTGELFFFGAITPIILIAAGITPKLDTGTNVTQASADGMANAAATDFLKLFFQNVTWAGVGDTTGIVGSGTAGSLYLGLHSTSPGEGGDQTSNEISYT